MNNTILRCKNCGALLVIPTKDLWKIGKCTNCESNELVNLNDEFSLVDVIGDKKDDIEKIYSR